MEASSSTFTGFNQPFLVQPELWHSTVPHISYRELVNLHATAKFGDFAEAQDSFNYAKRIWCKQVSMVTFVDTVHHADVKKADDVFSSLIDTRYDSGEDNVDRFRDELLNSIESLSDKSDRIEKITTIAVKMGYFDVIKKLYSTGKLDGPAFEKAIKSLLDKANRNEYGNVDSNSADQTDAALKVVEFNTEIITDVLIFLKDLPYYKNYHVHWYECQRMSKDTGQVARGLVISNLISIDVISIFYKNAQDTMSGLFRS